MLHQGSVEQARNKMKNAYIFSGTFLASFVVFHNKIFFSRFML